MSSFAFFGFKKYTFWQACCLTIALRLHQWTDSMYVDRRVLSPRDECTLVRKVQINPRATAKDLVKMLEETGTKVSISTVKGVLYRQNLKGHSARKKPLLQNRNKKPDYGLQLHDGMGTKIGLLEKCPLL